MNWTSAETTNMGSSGWLSPAILYDPGFDVWRLWTIRNTGTVSHYTAPSYLGPWTAVGTHDLETGFGIRVWHLEVKYLGSKFALMANVNGLDSNLWLGLSSDGTTWDMGAPLINPQVPYVYKGTFAPEFDGDLMRLRLIWDRYVYPLPAGLVPALYSETTNWVDLTTL